MASSHIVAVDDATLEKADETLTLALVHLRLLLRIKNRLRSPLLRLPTETMIRILSFTNEGCHYDWRSIFSTCHHIYMIMRRSPEVWWEVNYDCTTTSLRAAHISFMRSKGKPRVLAADLDPWDFLLSTDVETFHDYWRVNRVFQGSELHTLEFSGDPTAFDHFSWILEGSLPRLERLKIHLLPALDATDWPIPLPNPFALQLPPDIPLKVLDLHNVTRPWLPSYFTGLRELHLQFKHCSVDTVMQEDELLGILEASPRLEDLSLVRIRVGNNQQLRPKRIVRLPNLTSLWLANVPEAVGHILAYVDAPAITSLEIFAEIAGGDLSQVLGLLFPDDRLPKRLFSNPPVFKIGMRNISGSRMELAIGSLSIRFESDRYSGVGQNVVAACIPLVPSSVTTLQADFSGLDQQVWRDFFQSHPGVRSIGCYQHYSTSKYKTLWDALSPTQEDDPVVLCQNLESICFRVPSGKSELISLLACVRDRNIAGFKLRHLTIDENGSTGEAYKMVEDFRPLVDVLKLKFPPVEQQRVGPVSMDEVEVY